MMPRPNNNSKRHRQKRLNARSNFQTRNAHVSLSAPVETLQNPATSISDSSAASFAQRRQIPGFVWDAERGRYFPAVSRAANQPVVQSEQREQKRVKKINTVHQSQKIAQMRLGLNVSLFLRQRISASFSPNAPPWNFPEKSCLERLRLGFMIGKKRPVDLLETNNSIVTSLTLASRIDDDYVMFSGHRNGLVMETRINDGIVSRQARVFTESSEITSVSRLPQQGLLYTTMGGGGSDGTLVVCNMMSDTSYRTLSMQGSSVFCASIPKMPPLSVTTARQPVLAAVGSSGGVSVIGEGEAALRHLFAARTGSDILSTTFVKDDRLLACGGRDGIIRLFDIRLGSGQQTRKKQGLLPPHSCVHSSSVHGIGSVQGRMVVSASMDGCVRVWDIRMPSSPAVQPTVSRRGAPSAVCAARLQEPGGILAPCRLGFRVSEGTVAAAGGDNLVRIWSIGSGRLLKTVPLAPSGGPSMALDLDCDPVAPLPTLCVSQADSVYLYGGA